MSLLNYCENRATWYMSDEPVTCQSEYKLIYIGSFKIRSILCYLQKRTL